MSAWTKRIKRKIKKIQANIRANWARLLTPPLHTQLALPETVIPLRNGQELVLALSKSSPSLIEDMVELEHLAYDDKVMWQAMDFFEDIAMHPRTFYIQAFIAGELVGFIGCRKDQNDLHISNLAVMPNQQGKGIGTILLDQAVKQLSAVNRDIITLEVRLTNRAAQRFYKRHGFQVVDRLADYYTDNQEDALLMRAFYNQ